jgi:predicted nucleic acid-binding Zn ribbon protein
VTDGRPRWSRRPDSGPQHVAQSMAKLLGRLGASPSTQTMELVFTRWEEVVGPEFAEHLHPLRVQGAVLVIAVDHPAWATRTRMEAAQILAQVRALGDTSIERLEVVVQRP